MNPLELQQLVDGQLSHAQRADLLRALDPRDPQWRTLAMLLLEEQEWSKQIGSDSPVLAPKPADGSFATQIEPLKRTLAPKVYSHSPWLRTVLACCALFAIGLYGGYLSRYRSTDRSIQPLNASNSLTRNPVDTIAQNGNTFEYDSPLHLRLESPSESPIEIPLVDAREIDPKLIMANNNLEIAKLNQQFKRKGYEMNVKPTVYSGSLQDGRKFVIPVHDVSLKPFGL